MNWREIPFIRLSGSFALGVWIYFQIPQNAVWQAGLALCILLPAWGLLAGHRFRLERKGNLLAGMLLLLSMGNMGFYIAHQRDVRHLNSFLGRTPDGAFGGTVLEEKGRRLTLNLSVVRPETSSSWQFCQGRLLVYLPDTLRLSVGDTLLVSGNLLSPEPPRNPSAFDFRQYLAARGIYYQLFAQPGNFIVKPRDEPPVLVRWRQFCLSVLRRYLPDPGAFAVGAALVFGYRGALDETLQQAYSGSGAMHILAVSGLHVGLVYTGLGFLLGWLPAGRSGRRYLLPLLQIIGVWVFVSLSGLAPSAVRAAVMCSFFALGRMGDRRGHTLNTLAASAFCMLAVQPRLLFDLGFQLSYAAVAGILIFERTISRCWCPVWKPAAYLWKMTSVSLAAQLGTIPLSVYYFHQFPLFFWLTGFFAIPAATLILGGGLLLLPLQFAPGLAGLLGASLEFLIRQLNMGVRLIAQLPGSQLSGLWMDEWGVLIYYALLISILFLYPFRTAGTWYLMSVLLLLAGLRRVVEQAKRELQVEVVAYSVSGHTLLDFVAGRKIWSAGDSALTEKDLFRTAEPFRWSKGARVQKHLNLDQFAGPRALTLDFQGLKMLIVGPECRLDAIPSQAVEAVLIRGSPKWPLERLLRQVDAPLILFDGSCPAKMVGQWKNRCSSLGRSCRDLRREGAWHVSLYSLTNPMPQ